MSQGRAPLADPPYSPPIVSLVKSLPGPSDEEMAEINKGRSGFAGDAWVLGAEFRSIALSGDVNVFPACEPQSFGSGTPSEVVQATAFGIEVLDACSSFGFDMSFYWDRAIRKYEVRESFIIAREFWEGNLNDTLVAQGEAPNFTLTHSSLSAAVFDDISPGTLPRPHDALGRIDGAINRALLGAMGCIHMTIGMFDDIATAGGLVKVGVPTGTQMMGFTHAGTLCCADAGYPGTGPDGTSDPADEWEWMYATAMPRLYLEKPKAYPDVADYRQAMNRDNNNVEARAIGAAMVIVDPAVLVGIKATRAGAS